MNLNKFTKAELISKLKNSIVKNTKTLESRKGGIFIVEAFIALKTWLFRAAIVGIIVKIVRNFKKISLLRRVLRVANWLVLTIFGFSVMDHFTFVPDSYKAFKVILTAIVSYITTTSFYTSIGSVFGAVGSIKATEISPTRGQQAGMGGFYPSNEPKIRQSNGNSKILEWLKANEELKKDDSNNNKYYLLLLLLLLGLGGGAWYYNTHDYSAPQLLSYAYAAYESAKASMSQFKTFFSKTKVVAKEAADFLRKKEDKTFEAESQSIITAIVEWHVIERSCPALDIPAKKN